MRHAKVQHISYTLFG